LLAATSAGKVKVVLAWAWICVCAVATFLWLLHFREAKLANTGGFAMGYGAVYFLGAILELLGLVVLELFRTSKTQRWCSLSVVSAYLVLGLAIAY
jgi:hypothetical protein